MRIPQGGKLIKGGYFLYCQWCRLDGRCALRHHQFLGRKSTGKVDKSPYPGHENVTWHLSGFQQNTERAACNGRIFQTSSIFYPLQCECATVISSLTFSSSFGLAGCAKFRPNREGKERIEIAQKIADEKGIDISEVSVEGLLEPDPNYRAAMMY